MVRRAVGWESEAGLHSARHSAGGARRVRGAQALANASIQRVRSETEAARCSAPSQASPEPRPKHLPSSAAEIEPARLRGTGGRDVVPKGVGGQAAT